MDLLMKRKSNFDVDNAGNVISAIIFIAILLAVLLLIVVTIFGLTVFTGNGSINETIATIQTNIISMVSNFFALMPTIGTILAIVILVAVIVLLVIYVKRMKDSGTSSGQFQG